MHVLFAHRCYYVHQEGFLNYRTIFFSELLAEIERLKESSISSEPEINNSLNDEITMLREKLKETTAMLAESTK